MLFTKHLTNIVPLFQCFPHKFSRRAQLICRLRWILFLQTPDIAFVPGDSKSQEHYNPTDVVQQMFSDPFGYTGLGGCILRVGGCKTIPGWVPGYHIQVLHSYSLIFGVALVSFIDHYS